MPRPIGAFTAWPAGEDFTLTGANGLSLHPDEVSGDPGNAKKLILTFSQAPDANRNLTLDYNLNTDAIAFASNNTTVSVVGSFTRPLSEGSPPAPTPDRNPPSDPTPGPDSPSGPDAPSSSDCGYIMRSITADLKHLNAQLKPCGSVQPLSVLSSAAKRF